MLGMQSEVLIRVETVQSADVCWVSPRLTGYVLNKELALSVSLCLH